MNILKKTFQMLLLVLVLGTWSCQQEAQPDPQCYEGEVISLRSCRPIVEIKNAKIGSDWIVLRESEEPKCTNCVMIDNLPNSYAQIGKKIYFKNYEETSVFCLDVEQYPKTIIVTNFFNQNCEKKEQ